ncbi:hypothetical protein [Lyticum sinuosum]|uniref:Uncharacterized protein n=1 Tax=Lyticum sinuosum TaxID=1332059 RepID=A0AAE4VKE6_9RICK|nr:hypothetical protein [Lyticum sinuosum]MDZ5761586.1 hypothetical protein [Lyticum sinuosum]
MYISFNELVLIFIISIVFLHPKDYSIICKSIYILYNYYIELKNNFNLYNIEYNNSNSSQEINLDSNEKNCRWGYWPAQHMSVNDNFLLKDYDNK